MKNRKPPKKGVSFAPEKSDAEKTLDWEDESQYDPRRGLPPSQEDQENDIKSWMEKWTS